MQIQDSGYLSGIRRRDMVGEGHRRAFKDARNIFLDIYTFSHSFNYIYIYYFLCIIFYNKF